MLKDYNSQHITNEIRINYFHIVNLKKENVDVYRRYESTPLTDTVIRVRLYDDYGQDIMRAVSSITINDEETLVSGSSETVFPSGTSYTIHLEMKPGYIAIPDVSGVTQGEPLLDYKFLVALLSKAVLTLLNGSKQRILLVSDTDTSLHLSEVSALSATVIDVEVLEGMTGIDDDIFSGCPVLRTFTLPTTLTNIGARAFKECPELTRADIPDAVSGMGNSAFTECVAMTQANIGGGLEALPEYTFYGCSSLIAVSFNDGLEEIESGALESCTALTTVDMPDTLVLVGTRAFYGDESLTGVSFPTSFETIEQEAFVGCDSLIDVTFDGVETIKARAFSGDTAISGLTFPASLDTIEADAFAGCTGIENVVFSGGRLIKTRAFSGDSSIKEIEFAAALDTIEEDAFVGCSSLSSLTFNGVETIKARAFSGDAAITGIAFPSTLETIEQDAFRNCTAISSLTFNGITDIGDNAFLGCNNISGVAFPASLRTVGESAFSGSAKMSSITFDAGVTSIGANAFRETPISALTLPDTLTTIGNDAFRSSTSLTSLTLSTALTSVGTSAFAGSTSLQAAALPNSLTTISDALFSGCTSMTSLTLGNGVTSVGSAVCYNCSSLQALTVPNSVTGIGSSSFSGCTSLSSLTLGTGLQKLSANSFSNCAGLTSLTIPAGVNGIGNGAFSGCSGLDHIDVSAVTPATIGTNVFDSTNNCTIYVPWESLDTYKAATNWATYKTRISAYTHTISATANIEFDSNIKFTYKTTAYTYTSGYSSAHTYTLPAGVDYTVSAQTVLGYFDPSPKTVTGHSSADTAVSYSYTETRLSLLRSNGTVINIAKTSSNTAITTAMTSSLTTNAVTDVVKAKVGSGTKLIGDKAFSNENNRYGNLIEVDLPDGITNINFNAFWACKKLKNWYIGTGMTSVIYGAFARTINASRIYTRGGNPPAFDDGNNGYYVFCDDWSQPYGDNTYAGQIRWTGALIAPSSWSTWTTASPTQSTPLGYWNWYLAPSVIITQDYRSTGSGHTVWSACTEWTIPTSTTAVTQAFLNGPIYGYNDPKTALDVEMFTDGYTSTPVKTIGASAFTKCTNLQSITIHGANPPSLGTNALQGSFPIYVDKAYVTKFKNTWTAYASRIQPIIPLEKKYIV